jgi:hypothetical protein
MEEKTTLFDDLIKLYKDNLRGADTSKSLIDTSIKKESYEQIPKFTGYLKAYEEEAKELKKILQKHFRTQIEMEIPKLEKEYEKQQKFSQSAWESYGSELAGDFNKGEIFARNKLQLFKDLLT